MFKKGDRIFTHDGKVHRVRTSGQAPPMAKRDRFKIRGFIRGALIDPDGTEHLGDWHENVVTETGHRQVVRNFVGLASSASSVQATVLSDLGLARYWGIGYHTEAQSSNFSTQTAIGTELALASTGGTARATVSVGSQLLSGTWTLSQSFQYASTHLSHAQTVNCLAQHSHSSVGSGSALSLATFASSTKGTTQALNLTYNWLFST